MMLHSYPFDTQACFMNIGSYALTEQILDKDWLHRNGVTFNKEVELTSFELVNIETIRYAKYFSTGTFPAAKVIVFLKRHIGFYNLQVSLILDVLVSTHF